MLELVFEKLPLKKDELSIVYNCLNVPIEELSRKTK